jgi:hypothetical protein
MIRPFLFICFLIPGIVGAQSAQDSVASTEARGKFHWHIPAVLAGCGVISLLDADGDEFFINKLEVREERNENFGSFANHFDDYLQHVPSATTFILSLAKVKGKHDFRNQAILYVKSELVMLATVYSLKYTVGETRPDTGQKNSFPSGHTAQAFTAATFLAREYGHKSVWISIGAYTAATTVGTFRLLNNRHWISDVLVGAGIGILSTNLVYHTHRDKARKTRGLLTVTPFYHQSTGLAITYRF